MTRSFAAPVAQSLTFPGATGHATSRYTDPGPTPSGGAVAVTIREAGEADLDAVRIIFDYCYAFHRAAVPSVFRRAEDYRGSDEFLLSCIANPDAALLLAESKGQPVGLAYVLDRCAPDISVLAPRRYAILDTLAVIPRAQHTGIGRALLASAESWAHERGLLEIELSVWEFNERAHSMYRRAGYETTRRTMQKSLESSAADPRTANERT
jgi:GNAT superfamily N-acetyltransferase